MKAVSFVTKHTNHRTTMRNMCGEQVECVDTDVEDRYENPLSLDDVFVQHPASTFFVRVGSSEERLVPENKYLKIVVGDILTVDRSLTPMLGNVVLAVRDGVFTLCRFTEHEGKKFLVCGNGKCGVEEFGDDNTVYVWGVVRALSRRV